MKAGILSLIALTLVLITGSAFAETVAGLPLHIQKFESGADEASIRQVADQKNADNPTHYFLESDVNRLGYRFPQTERPVQAARLFRLNVELFPGSWNCYDSLGEALLATGDREGAVSMNQKSLELN